MYACAGDEETGDTGESGRYMRRSRGRETARLGEIAGKSGGRLSIAMAIDATGDRTPAPRQTSDGRPIGDLELLDDLIIT